MSRRSSVICLVVGTVLLLLVLGVCTWMLTAPTTPTGQVWDIPTGSTT